MLVPMKTSQIVVAALAAASLATPCLTAQVRTKKVPVQEQSFPEKVESAKKAFEQQEFSVAMQRLNEALAIARAHLVAAIRAKMPPAPEDFVVEKPRDENASANPYAAALLGGGAIPIEHSYKAKKGRHSIKVQVHANSTLVRMMLMGFNMAGANPKAEIIKYGAHKGLLEDSGKDRLKLTIVIRDKHAILIEAHGISDELLFKMFDQKFVDAQAKLLG